MTLLYDSTAGKQIIYPVSFQFAIKMILIYNMPVSTSRRSQLMEAQASYGKTSSTYRRHGRGSAATGTSGQNCARIAHRLEHIDPQAMRGGQRRYRAIARRWRCDGCQDAETDSRSNLWFCQSQGDMGWSSPAVADARRRESISRSMGSQGRNRRGTCCSAHSCRTGTTAWPQGPLFDRVSVAGATWLAKDRAGGYLSSETGR